MVVPQGYVEALERDLPAREVRLETPNTGVRVMTRRLKDARVVLLFNESSTALDDRLMVGKVGTRAEVWDSQSGKSVPVQTARVGEHADVPLRLAPYSTEVLVLR
jgi:hypothetical protein